MGEVSIETAAFAKIVLHAVKYPYCAVNGLLLADDSTIKGGLKVQDLDIIETIPLFHHSHYLSPMAEIALTQVESYAQSKNRTIVGYYAACENYNDNSIEKCPGQKIAEKIVEYFPSAVFIVVHNMRVMQHLDDAPLKIYRYMEGRWKPADNKVQFKEGSAMTVTSELTTRGVAETLADFDDFLDDLALDWTNTAIDVLIPTLMPVH